MATITVDIKALTGSFVTDIKRVERESKDVFANIERDAKRMGVAIGAGLAAGIAALAALTKGAINTADEMGKAAQRIGIATPELSKLSYAAKLADVDLAQLSTGITQLTKRMAENKDVFAAIGVQVTDSSGKLRKASDVFADVAEVFAGLEDGATKTRLAVDLFGRSGTQLIPLLNEGRDGLREMGDEAQRLGVVIEDETAAAAEQFNDDLTRLGVAFDGIFVKVAQEVLPTLNELVQKFNDPQFREGFETIATGAVNALAKVVDLIAELGNLTRFVGEAAGAAFGGIDGSDIVRLEDAVERKRNALGLLDAIGAGGGALAQSQRAELIRRTAALNAAREAAEGLAIQQARLDKATVEATGATKEQTAAEKAAIQAKNEMETRLKAYIESLGKGEDANRKLAQAERERSKALREALADSKRLDDQYQRELIQQEEALLDLARARDELQQHFDDQARDIETEIRLLGLSGEAREREIILLEAERLARDETGRVVEEQRQRYEDLLTTLAEAQKMERAAAEVAAVWADFTNDLKDALTDAIVDGGESGIEALKGAFENLQRDMTRGFIDAISAAFKDSGVQGVISGFSNNFGRGTGFRNSDGSMNWGNVGQVAAGAYGVYDNYRNGPGGSQGFWSGAASGAQAGSAFGTWGAIIGAIIGGIAGWVGGGKPTIRVADRESDAIARSYLDDRIGVARDRMEPGTATAFANAIAQFDNQIAAILDTYSGGGEQLERVRAALANWSIRVEGDAATIENVLTERFDEILSTFDASVQEFVRSGMTLEEQVSRLAEALVWPDQINAVLDAFAREELLASMTELQRQTYLVNEQFDALEAQFIEMHATEAQLLELEEHREAALRRLTNVQEQNNASLEEAEAAARSYAEFVSGFADGGGSGFQRALRDVQRELDATIAQANELARAAGLQAAREEDLLGARLRAQRQIEELIADLTETVVQQIADLYGTSADELQRQIDAIDAEIAGLTRDDSTFGFVQNMMREAQLGAERQRLIEEQTAALAEQERIQRRLGAMDLAQNLADLGLARGVRFEDLASELGLNLDRFGADLGITAEAVGDFIRELEADSLTADVFGQGVQDIVNAILGLQGLDGSKPIRFDDEGKPIGGKSRFNEVPVEPERSVTDELLIDEIRSLRRENATLLDQINTHAGAAVVEQRETNRNLRGAIGNNETAPGRTVLSRPKVRR